MHRLVARAAAAALLSSFVMGQAAMAQPPVGGCPPGTWELIEPIHEQAADRNADGLLCLKVFKDGSLLGIDNVLP